MSVLLGIPVNPDSCSRSPCYTKKHQVFVELACNKKLNE